MRKCRFSDAQIMGMTKEQEAGMSTPDVYRKHGVSQGTFYPFKSEYRGMEMSDAAKLRAVTDANTQLSRPEGFSEKLLKTPAKRRKTALRSMQDHEIAHRPVARQSFAK